jgi:hypothetical protein
MCCRYQIVLNHKQSLSLSSHLLLVPTSSWECEPNEQHFLLYFHKKMILLETIVSTLLNSECIQIRFHDLPLIITWFQFSHTRRFWVQYSFRSYRFHRGTKGCKLFTNFAKSYAGLHVSILFLLLNDANFLCKYGWSKTKFTLGLHVLDRFIMSNVFTSRALCQAVDMFARGTAVTLILFSSCKEPQTVLRSAGLRLI